MVNVGARLKYAESQKLDKKLDSLMVSITEGLGKNPKELDTTKSEDFSIGVAKQMVRRMDLMILLLMHINKKLKKIH